MVIAKVLALFLLFQGAPTARIGAITGQVRTLADAPVIALRVAAIGVPGGTGVPADGIQYFETAAPASTALTDNQGRYRLPNVPPGRYYIIAGVVGDGTFYPAAAAIEGASIVTVAPGATLPNIDFRLAKAAGGLVSGRVSGNMAGGPFRAVITGGKLEEFLDFPVGTNGTFEFGHVPPGDYQVSLFPMPPGLVSRSVKVANADVTGIQLVPPPTHAVTGRIVVQNGPLPRALLGFTTGLGYVNATINPDLTFSVRLHAARHRVDLGGMTVGYSVASIRVGSEDAAQGIVVGNTDVSGIVITVAAPVRLPSVQGTITGLPAARLASTKVEVTGPIVGSLATAVKPDGSFEIAKVIPGLYRLRLLQVQELAPITFVVGGWDATNIHVDVPTK